MTFQQRIMTPDDLHDKAKKMQEFLEQKPADQDEGLMTRLELLQVLTAQSGKMYADAKYWLDEKKNSSIMVALKEAVAENWSASIINKKVDALCKEENYLVNLLDRINSSAVHAMDATRTMISYRKEQMRMN